MNVPSRIKIFSGPILALIVLFSFDLSPGNPMVTKMAAVAIWMAAWWFTEAVALAITALLPLILLPITGILDGKTTAVQYMDQTIFLFIGGFIIAIAIERWQLHQRIALKILTIVGSKPVSILFGVMIATFSLSMWISNTATVMMLIPAVLAVIYQIEYHLKNEEQVRKISLALLLGLAYSATIGGMATLVGTPTNMIFLRQYNDKFPDNHDMNFANWFVIAFPLALVFMLLSFFIISQLFLRRINTPVVEKEYFSGAYKKLGPMNYEEKVVSIVFSLTALLWFTRSDIDFGIFVMRGWDNLFKYKEFLNDSTVALFMAILLFIIPARSEKTRAIMIWEDAKRLPLDIILLFGGGFALAKGFEVSGLSTWLARHLSFLSGSNIYLFIFIMCVITTLISEFASNVACIQLMIPVLLVIQKDMNIHPLILLIPATLAASLGFMMPVATAPNTIVFGTNKIKTHEMMKTGFWLNLIGVILITLTMLLISGIYST